MAGGGSGRGGAGATHLGFRGGSSTGGWRALGRDATRAHRHKAKPLGYDYLHSAVDDRTLEIHLAKPYPRLADNLAQGYSGIQSQHALETRTAEQNCEQPIGSGAFVVDHWDRGEQIVLKRNEVAPVKGTLLGWLDGVPQVTRWLRAR